MQLPADDNFLRTLELLFFSKSKSIKKGLFGEAFSVNIFIQNILDLRHAMSIKKVEAVICMVVVHCRIGCKCEMKFPKSQY